VALPPKHTLNYVHFQSDGSPKHNLLTQRQLLYNQSYPPKKIPIKILFPRLIFKIFKVNHVDNQKGFGVFKTRMVLKQTIKLYFILETIGNPTSLS
tara:strand:- start:365 stop:652 length:288 start_codon:yes stop_codon:yes gene_type:complete